MFEFLNIVDLATSVNNRYPVPSKRPDDVLSVLEMVWINWAGPVNHLISDMGGEFEGELGEFIEAHGIRQDGHVERNGRIRKVAARKVIKDVGAQGFVEMRRLASMVNWAKSARINSTGYSPAQWVCGRGYKLPWSILNEKQSGELASLELPDHSLEFGRRMSWLWTPPTATCVACWCARERPHTRDCEQRFGEFGERSRETKPTRERHSLPIVVWPSHCGPQRENNVFSSRTRNESCTRMSPNGKRSRANELGYHDERENCLSALDEEKHFVGRTRARRIWLSSDPKVTDVVEEPPHLGGEINTPA